MKENQGKIQYSFVFDVPIEKAFSATSTGSHIKNWWTQDASIEPEAGSVGTFEWDAHGWVVKMEVKKLEKGKILEWECVHSNMQDTDAWVGTKLLFEFVPLTPNKTQLNFVQSGYRTSPCRDVCNDGWRFVLGSSLKRYLETDAGMPYTEKKQR